MNRRASGIALLAAVAVSALAGGGLASLLLAATRDVDRPAVLAAAALLGMVFCVLAVSTFVTRPAAPAAPGSVRTRPDPPAAARDRPDHSGTRSAAGDRADRSGAWSGTAGRSQPAAGMRPGAAVERPWWDDPHPRGPAGDPRPAATRPAEARPVLPPLTLPPYRADTRVVQCGRCGSFAVDVAQRDPGFALDCTACGGHWESSSDTEWPVVVVRPRLHRRTRPEPA